MIEQEQSEYWQVQFSNALAVNKSESGWPPRTLVEQTELFRQRSDTYMQLMLSLDEEQLALLQLYLQQHREERQFWSQRCFYLGYKTAQDATLRAEACLQSE